MSKSALEEMFAIDRAAREDKYLAEKPTARMSQWRNETFTKVRDVGLDFVAVVVGKIYVSREGELYYIEGHEDYRKLRFRARRTCDGHSILVDGDGNYDEDALYMAADLIAQVSNAKGSNPLDLQFIPTLSAAKTRAGKKQSNTKGMVEL